MPEGLHEIQCTLMSKLKKTKLSINFVAVTANFAAGDYRLRRGLGRDHPRRPARPPRLPHTQGAEEAESAPSRRRKLTGADIHIREANDPSVLNSHREGPC